MAKSSIWTRQSPRRKGALKAYFEKPAFLDRNQRLLIEGPRSGKTPMHTTGNLRAAPLGWTENWPATGGAASRFTRKAAAFKDNEHDAHDYAVISPQGGFAL